ncbi:MAG: 30S ribosomal protein S8 [Candidatus Paceibacterota bacterium]
MDTVANMLTMIRNAQAVAKPTVTVPFSRLKYDVAKILERRGFVAGVEKKSRKMKKTTKVWPCLEISLKYVDKIPAISGYKKVSKPGQRIYVAASDIKRVKQGHGIGVVSTSRGLLTEYEAKKQNVGGEMLCEIW